MVSFQNQFPKLVESKIKIRKTESAKFSCCFGFTTWSQEKQHMSLSMKCTISLVKKFACFWLVNLLDVSVGKRKFPEKDTVTLTHTYNKRILKNLFDSYNIWEPGRCSKDKSKQHRFVWGKEMLRWDANVDKTGFSETGLGESIKTLQDSTEFMYLSVTVNSPYSW